MNGGRQWLPLLAALLLLLAAFGWLFQLRLGSGDIYPEYSSLRADALGTRALFEALELVPGLQVERDYRPLAQLSPRPRLILLPGLRWQDWQSVPVNQLAALNTAAGNGARVVLAFRADLKREKRDSHGRPVEEETEGDEKDDQAAKNPASGKDAKDSTKKPKGPGVKEWEPRELAKEWGVTLKQRWLVTAQKGAQRVAGATDGLPLRVAWQSDLYFAVPAESGWRVLYRRAGEPVLVEKAVGRGSIVLLADAYCLSNEAMQRERATGLLAWLVGDCRRVTFLESPLGVLENNGIGFLARHYGLGGALALCGLLGALYAWRRLVAFLPPQETRPAAGGLALAYEPAAGFTGLLRRSLGSADLLRVCVEEWRKGRRSGGGSPAAAARLEAAWQAHNPQQRPLATTYNALARALKPR